MSLSAMQSGEKADTAGKLLEPGDKFGDYAVEKLRGNHAEYGILFPREPQCLCGRGQRIEAEPRTNQGRNCE